MLFRKAKRVLAGVCVAAMLITSVGQDALVSVAAENTAYEQEAVTEDVSDADAPTEDVSDAEIPAEDVSDAEIPAEDVTEVDAATEDVSSADAPVGEEAESEEVSYGITTGDQLLNDGTLIIGKNHVLIGDTAFVTGDYVSQVKHIVFEENSGLKEIGKTAFTKLPELQSVDFSNCHMLTGIRDNAFASCPKLETVTFSEELQMLGKNAFASCPMIKEITLPAKLTEMSGGVFSGCTGLKRVTVETNNLKCGTGIFAKCSIEEIVFANNNTMVPDNLFNGAGFKRAGEGEEPLTIQIPYFIQEIGDSSFKGCTTLINLEIEDTQEHPSALAALGNSAFSGCSFLENVVLPKSVKKIGASAFEGCKSFTDILIPNTVTEIGTRAYKDCNGATSLQISNAATKLGTSLFEGCTSLTEVEIPTGIMEITDYMFQGCTRLSSVEISSTVSTVGKGAFKKCTSIVAITIPDTVSNVEGEVFMGCSSLVNPILPKDLTELASSLFENCISLQTISTSAEPGPADCLIIPEKITTVQSKAFRNCDSIRNIEISEGVTYIGGEAFADCQAFNQLKICTKNLTTCGTKIFCDDRIVSVYFPEGITEIPANLFSCAGFTTNTTLYIPASVKSIGKNAFGGTSSIPTNIYRIVFEEGSKLETIGDTAFAYCTAVTEFTIPDTVTSIGTKAFQGCIKLKEITIPEKVTTIGGSAFSECSVLTTIYYNAIAVTSENKNIFEKCNIHTILIGPKVTILPAYLFYGANFSKNQITGAVDLITLTIPAAVKKIGDYSFANIANITEIEFAAGSRLEEVGIFAFNACSSLAACRLPETVTIIGNGAFSDCVVLEDITLPSRLTTLGDSAFKNCAMMGSYVIPENVGRIGTYTFFGNTNLTSVEFAGKKVTEIGAFAFAQCPSLSEIIIPNGVATIGNNAFEGDTALEKVVIPISVSSIGANAFAGCTNPNLKFYVVPGSYAEKWLKDNHLDDKMEEWQYGAKVEKPTASPASYSIVPVNTRIMISTETLGATIYYTMDGSEPTTASSKYTGDIVITEDVTIRAFAVKEGFEDSDIADFVYTLEEEVIDWGDLDERDREKFSSPDEIPTGLWVAGFTDMTYTGKAITFPELRVYDNKTLLKEKKDYKVTYSNNKLAADKNTAKKKPTVTITGLGNYNKKSVNYFTIKQADIAGASAADILLAVKPKNAIQKPVPVVTFNGTKLANKKDFTLTYSAGDGFGTAGNYTITINGNGNFTGTKKIQCKLTELTLMSKVKVSGVKTAKYTGSPITQELVVKNGSKLMTEGVDYTVQYSNNTAAGKATITLTGKGSYIGEKVVTFQISPVATINKTKIGFNKASVVYTGEPVELGTGADDLKATVTYKGETLKEGVDYRIIKYETNINAGTAKITFEGMNAYSGTVKKSIPITPADLKSAVVEVKAADGTWQTSKAAFAYCKGGVKPEVRVTFGGKVLEANKDYTLEYSNNDKSGTAKATVTGMKNYTGKKSGTYKINKKELRDVKIIAQDVVYAKKTGIYTGAKPVLTDVSGVKLVNNADYKIVSYTYAYDTYVTNNGIEGVLRCEGSKIEAKDILPAGTVVRVWFEAVSTSKTCYYVGRTSAVFQVVPQSIAKAKIKVKNQTYTGQEVKPDKDDITVTIGKVVLSKDDYEIIGYSKNVAKGTATITIRGIGNYGGISTGKFTIVQKEMAIDDRNWLKRILGL